jgi:predicted CXXCH cytochrome family protein
MSARKLTALAAALVVVTAWGCGSNMESDGAGIGSPDVAAAQHVGIDNCAQCHTGVNTRWLASPHGNPDRSPDLAIGNLANCVSCHNRDGDGEFMSLAYGINNRAVVGCETCHGGGQYHFALGPLPRPNPGVEVCATCHNATIPHSDTDIAGAFAQSKHGQGAAVASRASLGAHCAMCHSDDGFRQYGQRFALQGGYAYLNNVFAGEPARETWEVVQCRTCHAVHSGELNANASANFSQQFNLCTSCHQVFAGGDGRLDQGAYGTTEANLDKGRLEYHHPLANSRVTNYSAIISDTHFDGLFPTFKRENDANVYDGHVQVAGYGVIVTAEDACTRCHNPHSTMFQQ